MTTVCCACGYLVVTGRSRCSHCRGVAVSIKAARRALGVESFRRVIEASPERRVRALSARRA
jgi:uncharacterized OB-fold protein